MTKLRFKNPKLAATLSAFGFIGLHGIGLIYSRSWALAAAFMALNIPVLTITFTALFVPDSSFALFLSNLALVTPDNPFYDITVASSFGILYFGITMFEIVYCHFVCKEYNRNLKEFLKANPHKKGEMKSG